MSFSTLSPQARLYAILDLGYVSPENAPAMAQALLAGGADVLQLRAKNTPHDQITRIAKVILPICHDAAVPFIINDHPDIAAAVGADGVHIGQDDGTVVQARKILGPGKIVGKSTHSIQQAVDAAAEEPDYIGFGPLFATPTKPDYPPIGLEHIAKVHQLVKCPIFCIGGIKPHNVADILSQGARRIVVVSALLQAPDPAALAREMKLFLRTY